MDLGGSYLRLKGQRRRKGAMQVVVSLTKHEFIQHGLSDFNQDSTPETGSSLYGLYQAESKQVHLQISPSH
ncbi:hypothetical protein SLE2022_036200 [Rubroshorea leprosula]